MARTKGQRRDFGALEERRMRAAALFLRGELSQAEIARRIGVSRESVRKWYDAWRENGKRALKAAGRAGRKPRLSRRELAGVERALLQGARYHGYSTELWTLPRIAAIIEKLTGVCYHPGHVWKILRWLGWSPQRPVRRARERNEAEIARFRSQGWRRIKKKPAGKGPGLSLSTSPGSPNERPSGAPGRRGVKPRS